MPDIHLILTQFDAWLADAKAHPAITEPTAMCLSTVGEGGKPSSRMVLLKQHDERGFAFFTNFESRKSKELKQNSHAALCFYWMVLGRQIRIEGKVEQATREESEHYFATRSRESRLGAWASHQSQALGNRTELEKAYREIEKQFEGKDVPCPPHWGGWRVMPGKIEFWHEGAHRLHQREVYTRVGDTWSKELLYP